MGSENFLTPKFPTRVRCCVTSSAKDVACLGGTLLSASPAINCLKATSVEACSSLNSSTISKMLRWLFPTILLTLLCHPSKLLVLGSSSMNTFQVVSWNCPFSHVRSKESMNSSILVTDGFSAFRPDQAMRTYLTGTNGSADSPEEFLYFWSSRVWYSPMFCTFLQMACEKW